MNEIANLISASKINYKTSDRLNDLETNFKSIYTFSKLSEIELSESLVLYNGHTNTINKKIITSNFWDTESLQSNIETIAILEEIQDNIKKGKSIKEPVNKLNISLNYEKK